MVGCVLQQLMQLVHLLLEFAEVLLVLLVGFHQFNHKPHCLKHKLSSCQVLLRVQAVAMVLIRAGLGESNGR
jgi:hypothetical protein